MLVCVCVRLCGYYNLLTWWLFLSSLSNRFFRKSFFFFNIFCGGHFRQAVKSFDPILSRGHSDPITYCPGQILHHHMGNMSVLVSVYVGRERTKKKKCTQQSSLLMSPFAIDSSKQWGERERKKSLHSDNVFVRIIEPVGWKRGRREGSVRITEPVGWEKKRASKRTA